VNKGKGVIKMAKLHETLAVEGELEGAYKKILQETLKTLKDKANLFMGFVKKYVPFDDNEKTNESFEESHRRDTTVNSKIDYMFSHVIPYLDAVAQKDRTNQEARANVEINGKVLISDVPSTTLLGLESKIRQIREVLVNIPTLDAGMNWVKDVTDEDHVWKLEAPQETFKTAKIPKSKVVYEATKEHRAEIDRWNETINIGKYLTTHWSGMMTTAEKSQLLGRVDILSQAIKQARQRANTTEVQDIHVGQKIRDFVLDGVMD